MKRKFFGAILGFAVVAGAASGMHSVTGVANDGAFLRSGAVYPAAVRVVDTSDGIRCVLSTGIEYHIDQEAEDLEPGDLLAVIMYDSGTPGDVRDDKVISYSYSGF